MKKLFLALLFYNLLLQGQTIEGYTDLIYKQSDSTELKIWIKSPATKQGLKKSPAIIFFFGGGWSSGNILQFKPHADYFSSKGMVAVLADYRVRNRHKTTPFDAVTDAKSAIRFIRKNAEKFGINADMIVASGGSAGGHLAAATATIEGLNDIKDDLHISPVPNALILFNPVIDNGPTGYGYERVKEQYVKISPMHNIRKEMPPTIIFLGTKDDLIPVETIQLYKKRMDDASARCDLFLYEGQKHGFFNYRVNSNNANKFYFETIHEADKFLVSLGFIK